MKIAHRQICICAELDLIGYYDTFYVASKSPGPGQHLEMLCQVEGSVRPAHDRTVILVTHVSHRHDAVYKVVLFIDAAVRRCAIKGLEIDAERRLEGLEKGMAPKQRQG